MSAGSYDFAMDPQQYAQSFQNVNPYTEGIYNQLIPGLQGFTNQSLSQGYNPNAFFQQFMGAAPQLQQLTTDITSPIAQQQQNYLSQLTDRTIGQVGNQLSKLGAVNSSAFPRLVGEALAPEIAQASTQLASQRAGIFSGLAQTTLPLFAQGQQQQFGYGLQAAGLLGGLANPDFVAPDIVYNQSGWERIGQPLVEAGLGSIPLFFT